MNEKVLNKNEKEWLIEKIMRMLRNANERQLRNVVAFLSGMKLE